MRPRAGFTSWHVAALLSLTFTGGILTYLARTEMPMGALCGRALSATTGLRLSRTEVIVKPHEPNPALLQETVVLHADREGKFGPQHLPAGHYTIQAHSRGHSLAPTEIAIGEGQVRNVALELARQPSRLKVYLHQHVCSVGEPAMLLCEGLLQDNDMVVSVYATDLDRMMLTQKADLRTWVAQVERRFPEGIAASEHCKLVASGQVPVRGRDAEGVFQQRVRVPLPRAGLYLLTISADGIRKKEWALVSDLGLILKTDGDRLLAYVTHIVTGQPMPGVKLTAYPAGEPAIQAVTGPDGLALLRSRAPSPAAEVGEGATGWDLMVLAEQGGSLAAVHTFEASPEARDFQWYLTTDRPVYRPGDVVQFKGILRQASGDRYLVPAGEPVDVTVRDGRQTLLYRRQLRTNDYGTLHGDLRLPGTATTGHYELMAEVRGRPHESGFEVAAYRKPQFEVTIKSDKERVVSGAEAEVTLKAEYYFGTPVAGAEVTYTVHREPYWFGALDEEQAGEQPEESDEEGYRGNGPVELSGELKTDKRGIAHLRIPTHPEADQEDTGQDWRYRVSATVTGPGWQTAEAEGQFLVTQGEFRLEATPSRWAARPGEDVQVALLAMDYDRRPQPNMPVEVTVEHERWADREPSAKPLTTVLLRLPAATDAQGKATVSLKAPAQGEYVLRAAARDRLGNRIQQRQDLWVTSQEYADLDYRYPELEIVTDKRSYEVGDTIRALVNTKVSGAVALVSVEGRGLRRWFLQQLRGKSTLVQIPVLEEYAPNVYLTVGFVRNREFFSREKRVAVSPRPKTLTVELRTDRNEYHPGDLATCELLTRDPRGRPTPAELSLGVVDEAIYAIREDSPGDMLRAFYPGRSNRVDTSYSFPRLQLGPAAKGAGLVPVRKRFPDTALWLPDLRTDGQGRARVRFKVPDTLTKWRLTARGCTLRTLVGSAVGKFVCKKDFMARLQMPRFLVNGDESILSGVIHNETAGPLSARAALAVGGCDVLRAPRLDFTLLPGDAHLLDWHVVARAVGSQAVRLTALGAGGLNDALEQRLPIYPRAREQVEWRAGVLDRPGAETFATRADALKDAGGARLLLAPSLTSPIWEALDYLAQYPWGCVEQTMSSFLPDVVILRALRQHGLTHRRLQAELPDMVRAGLFKLYGFQLQEGGWGWWRYDGADPWMTAYVLFGLLEAQEAGFPVNPRVRRDGFDCLASLLKGARADDEATAFAAYVLARAKSPAAAQKALLPLQRRAQALPPGPLALMTLAYQEMNDTAHAQETYIRLWAKSRTPGTLCSWPAGDNRSDAWMTDTEATALALKASLAVRPQDPRLSHVVSWLMTRREGPHWVSTRDTAFVLYALADYVRLSQELTPDFALQVRLNGRPLGGPLRFGPGDVFAPQRVLDIPAALLRPGQNVLRFDRQGRGNLCYSLQLTQYVPDQDLAEVLSGSGLRLERSYHRVVLSRDPESGMVEPRPEGRARTRFRQGDVVLVHVSLTTPVAVPYVMLEDPLPAGCEVTTRGDVDLEEWGHWYSDISVRDDRVGVFARSLPAGRSEIEYHLRLEVPGRYYVRPATVSCMYQPGISATNQGTVLEVR